MFLAMENNYNYFPTSGRMGDQCEYKWSEFSFYFNSQSQNQNNVLFNFPVNVDTGPYGSYPFAGGANGLDSYNPGIGGVYENDYAQHRFLGSLTEFCIRNLISQAGTSP